jgi:uncharacterized protein
MPAMTRYEHGVPSWVDIGSHDLAASVRFYTGFFGWDPEDMGEEAGHYTIVSKDGKQIAALSTAQDPGPPRWTMYVNVDDVDKVAERVGAAGGSVVFGPMDVMDQGRLAVFSDSTGAVVSAWQPGRHVGAQLVNEPGAFIWSELATSDLGKSKAFYHEVFGWDWGGSDEYAEGQVSGRTIAGVRPRGSDLPAEVPDHWLIYFGSSDVDADTERAKALGATVLVEPTDVPNTGRFSVLSDPEGAAFAIFQG